MVHPDVAKWGQSPSDLRKLASTAEHPRSRERYLGLYMIASGQTNATQWAHEIGRTTDTVLRWVHQYNKGGAEAVVYQRSGGRPPFLAKNRQKKLQKSSGKVNPTNMSYLVTTGASKNFDTGSSKPINTK